MCGSSWRVVLIRPLALIKTSSRQTQHRRPVEVLEPSVIYDAKDGKYGEDGSESFEDYKKKILNNGSTKLTTGNPNENLKQQITYLIGMERQSGSMEVCSPLYVSRMLNVPLEDVERCMKEMGV